MARQPVLDRQKQHFGFELLFRDQSGQFSALISGDEQSARVILNRFSGLSEETSSSSMKPPMFVNMDLDYLIHGGLLETLYASIIVDLQPVENITSTQCTELLDKSVRGLRICLDDYRPEAFPDALLELAGFVKLNTLALGNELEQVVATLHAFTGDIIFKHIESEVEFQRCLALGGHYFQGMFLQKPDLVTGRTLSPQSKSALMLLAEVNAAETTPERLERAICADAMLTMQLLRLINSAAFGLQREVHSLREAIIFLGIDALRQWTVLLLMARQDHKSPELMRVNLVRAAFCRELASIIETVSADKAFLVGLLSMIDAYLDWPRNELIKGLPLAADVAIALMSDEGPLGEILSSVRDYEAAQWSSLEQQQFAESVWGDIYQRAILWADETLQLIKNS